MLAPPFTVSHQHLPSASTTGSSISKHSRVGRCILKHWNRLQCHVQTHGLAECRAGRTPLPHLSQRCVSCRKHPTPPTLNRIPHSWESSTNPAHPTALPISSLHSPTLPLHAAYPTVRRSAFPTPPLQAITLAQPITQRKSICPLSSIQPLPTAPNHLT